MKIIVILVILAIMLYGVKVMEKIDIFIDNNINEKYNNKETIILYGDEDISKVKELLQCNNIKYKVINDLLLNKDEDNTNYVGIIALSKDDFNNIFICVATFRYYGVNNKFSICNDIQNKKVYDRYNIETIDINEINTEEFISRIREKLGNV